MQVASGLYRNYIGVQGEGLSARFVFFELCGVLASKTIDAHSLALKT